MANVWLVTIHVARDGAPFDTVYSVPGDRATTPTEAINVAFADFSYDYNLLRAPATVTSVVEDESAQPARRPIRQGARVGRRAHGGGGGI